MMIRALNSEMQALEPRVPLRNIHLAEQLHVFQNSEILILFQSSIHIHSIANVVATLPSLIHTIDLQEIASRIPAQGYQDALTRQITSTQKGSLAKVIFSPKLEERHNVFMREESIRGRLKFLGAQLVTVKDLQISIKGHLLLTFEDGRAVFIRRNSAPQSTSASYNPEDVWVINSCSEAPILCAVLEEDPDRCPHPGTLPGLLCGFEKDASQMALCRVELTDHLQACKMDVLQVHKKVVLPSRGLVNMHQVYCGGAECTAVVYYSRLFLLDLAPKANNLEPGNAVRVIELAGLLGPEFLINSKYDDRTKSLFVYSSQNVGLLSFEEEIGVGSRQETNGPFSHVDVVRLEKEGKHSGKTTIAWIGGDGNFIDNSSQWREIYCSTDNGVIIKLAPSSANYKEGHLSFHHQGPVSLTQKMCKNARTAQKTARCLNFDDLPLLEKSPDWETMKKEVRTELSKVHKQAQAKGRKGASQKIVNVLILNLLNKFGLKGSAAAKVLDSEVSSMGGGEGKCYVSGRTILTQDVMECSRCNLYAIKEEFEARELGCRCPVCWNRVQPLC